MITWLPSVVRRCLLGVLLLAALGSCSVYHKVFHPFRLPTPKASPEFIAQQKAAEKAKKDKMPSGLFKKRKAASVDPEAATDVSTPGGGTITAPSGAPVARTLPEKSTVRYDKNGLMKNKPKLMRRRVHKNTKPFRPWQLVRNFFKYGLHGKPNYDPSHRAAPRVPAPAPDAPAPDKP